MKKLILRILKSDRILFNRPSKGRVLYLTFDDGPHSINTEPMLDLLAEMQVKATFFVVGRDVVNNRGIVERTVREGHEIGNHSMTHPRMDMLSDQGRLIEIRGMNRLLKEYDHRTEHLFRPPYGRVSMSLMWFCLKKRFNVALWSRDSMDYRDDAEQVVRGLVERPVSSGDIVLFHDDGAVACKALRELIPLWKSQGYYFSTLTQSTHS